MNLFIIVLSKGGKSDPKDLSLEELRGLLL